MRLASCATPIAQHIDLCPCIAALPSTHVPVVQYELPDGKTLDIGNHRLRMVTRVSII